MANDAAIEVFFEENAKGLGLGLGGGIDWSERRMLTFLKFDMMIELQVMVRESFGFHFAETFNIVVVFGRDF